MSHVVIIINHVYDITWQLKLLQAFAESGCVKLTMFQNDPNSGVTKSKSGTTKVGLSLQVKLPQDSNLEEYY